MNYSKKFLLSLLLHAILFLSMGLYLQMLQPVGQDKGDQQKQATQMAAYLYQGSIQPAPLEQQAPQALPSPPRTSSQTSQKQKETSSSKANQSSAGKQGETKGDAQHDDLLMLLHVAIKRQQKYPPSALRMKRQGRATVGFTLYPNGSIEQLRLMKSSGTSSLDSAALEAVRLAAPFTGVDAYMRSSETFKIDVVFALGQGV